MNMMIHSTPQLHRLHVIGNGVFFRQRHSRKLSNLKKKQLIKTSWICCGVSKTQHRLTDDDRNLLTFSMGFSSDTPISESAGRASFDQYLEDKPRLLKATFPGKSHQLNQEEWRIEMPKIELLFLKIWPVVDMKVFCKTSGEDYPPDVPRHIPKVLEFEMTNWDINGIHANYRPSSASVFSRGAIYSEKGGSQSQRRLKFHLLMNLSFIVPDGLSFVPKDVFRSIVETVLKAMIEDMKRKTIQRLVEDYSEFRKEKTKKQKN